MKLESEVQQELQIEAAKCGAILERNNSGMLYNEQGTPVRYGLGNTSAKHQENMKSSDLIGGQTIIVTPEMVGQRLLVMVAVEAKREDWSPKELNKHEIAQLNYMKWIVSRGGKAGFAKNVDDLHRILKG